MYGAGRLGRNVLHVHNSTASPAEARTKASHSLVTHTSLGAPDVGTAVPVPLGAVPVLLPPLPPSPFVAFVVLHTTQVFGVMQLLNADSWSVSFRRQLTADHLSVPDTSDLTVVLP